MPNPRMTTGDVAWSILFLAILVPLMIGCLVAVFALLGPYIDPSTGAQTATMKVFGAVVVGLAILLSGVLSVSLFCLFTRYFLSTESYARWQRQFENGKPRVSPIITALAGCILKMGRPSRANDAL